MNKGKNHAQNLSDSVCRRSACLRLRQKTETAALDDGKIYFFYYNECPYCHDAIDYIDRQYPNLNMAMVNIHVGNGFELFKACGEKFRLGNSIGTPLFCMGGKYLMGWSENNVRKFDEYVKPYLK